MTKARIFPNDTNFQQMARQPGEISRDQAIKRAEAEIAAVKVEFDEWLDRELSELATEFAAVRNRSLGPKRLGDLARRSRQLHEVTATMGFELLSFVAASLCKLLDLIDARSDLPVDAILCHFHSLNLAAQPNFRELGPEQVPELAQGLRRLVEHANT